jgi:hypothetical protein
MATKISIAGKDDRLAQIDSMLLQRINEVEQSRNGLAEGQSYREKYFANLCKDVFDVED